MAGSFDLKDDKQAKEYLDQVGIEYRYQCYSEGRADGCHRLGDYLEAFKHEYDKARRVYAMNCHDKQYAKSCFKLGNYNLLGRACKKDYLAALDAYRRGCSSGNCSSCFNAALLMEDGRGHADGHKDLVAASEFLQSACNLGDAPACHRLSLFFIAGKGVAQDMKQAFSYAKLACDKDFLFGCQIVSVMYAKGDGVKQDAERAEFYKQKTIELRNNLTQPVDELKFDQ